MVRFAYTILYVTDVTASIEFYEASFGFIRKFITPENDYGELATGSTTISFASHALANSNLKGGYIKPDPTKKPFACELGFVTDDVNTVVTLALKNGAILVEEPLQKPWGQTVAYIRDPDGFLLEICTPVAH